MRGGYILYQDLADPIVPEQEEVTLDKYFKDHPLPVLRKILPMAILAGSFFMYSEPIAAAEEITQDKWGQPISQPYFSKYRQLMPTGESRFEVPRTIYIDDWQQPIQQPYFSKRRDVPSGESRFEVPREILITDWWQPASEPIRRKVERQTGGETRTEYVVQAEEVTLDKWYQPLAEPVRRKVTRQTAGDTRTDIVVELDKWYRPASEPYFAKRRNYFTGETRFEVPREILISDWWQQLSEPVRRKLTREPGLYVRIDPVADDTKIDEWFEPIRQPYFSKKRNYITGEFRFEVPREILISDWIGHLSQPYFGKRRNYFTGESRFEVPREILLSDWYQPISQPRIVKFRDSKTGAVLVDFSVPGIEEITLDKWYKEIIQPRIVKRRDYFTGEFRFEIPRTILISDWFAPTQQPRIVRGVTQGIFVSSPIPVVPFSWSIQNQQQYRKIIRSTGDIVFVGAPIEVITLDKWFGYVSQPRIVRRSASGLFILDPLPIVPFDWYSLQPDRVRKIIDRVFTGEARTELSMVVEEITMDKWYAPIVQPYFGKARFYQTGNILVIIPTETPVTPYYPFECPAGIVIVEKGSESISVIEMNSGCQKVIYNKT